MGYRVQPWSEEMPRQMTYQADPRLAEQYQRMGEEQYAREVNQQEKNTEATRDVLARQQRGMDSLNEGAVRGVGNFVEARERGQDRRMKQAAFDREGALSEEQLATAKQQRELAAVEEQRRGEAHPLEQRERESRVAGTEADTKGKLAVQAFNDAIATQPDALEGETNAGYRERMGLKAVGYNAETGRLQVQNETQRIAHEKELFPLKKRETEAGIRASDAQVAAAQAATAETRRVAAVRDATNIIMAETSNTMGDPKARQDRIQAAMAKLKADGASPSVVAEAINNANASADQKAFMAKQMQAMDPEFGAKTASQIKGFQDAELYQKQLALMQSAYKEYKASSNLPDDKGDIALQKFKDAVKPFDTDGTIVKSLESSTGGLSDLMPGKTFFGRTDRMNQIMGDFRTQFADQLDVLNRHNPKFGGLAQNIRNTPIGDPSGSQAALKYVPTGPQQSMVGDQMSRAPASVQGLQGIPGVKIRPQVGQK